MRDDSEIRVGVHNLVLLKSLQDDDDQLMLVGTMIQHSYLEGEEIAEEIQTYEGEEDWKWSNGLKFEYRFNEEAADGESGFTRHRRTELCESLPDAGKCYRHTFTFKAPLELDVVFNLFPFKVYSATLEIELLSLLSPDNTTRFRPDLLLHRTHKWNMTNIRKGRKSPNNVDLLDKLDQSYKLDLIGFPKVAYFYDKKKRHCPRYEMKFLLVEDGMKKLIDSVFPVILVGVLNTVHVLNPEDYEVSDHVANSAALALAVVFNLSNMTGNSRRQTFISGNNLYIITIFLALALSSLPEQMVGSKQWSYAGMGLYWTSFVFPLYNAFMYLLFYRKQRGNRWSFDMPKNHKPYWMTRDSVSENFMTVEEVAMLGDEARHENGYKAYESGNFREIHYS